MNKSDSPQPTAAERPAAASAAVPQLNFQDVLARRSPPPDSARTSDSGVTSKLDSARTSDSGASPRWESPRTNDSGRSPRDRSPSP